jgi:hypothetical protein
VVLIWLWDDLADEGGVSGPVESMVEVTDSVSSWVPELSDVQSEEDRIRSGAYGLSASDERALVKSLPKDLSC